MARTELGTESARASPGSERDIDMSTRQLSSAIIIAAAFAVPVAARADATPNAGHCFLDESRVVAVTPYYGKRTLGAVDLQPLRGAKVQLVPTTGFTAEHLEERLQELLEARQQEPLPTCLVDVGHVHIESTPLGEASSVTLIARDPSDAEQVFRRARHLVGE